MDEGIVQTTNQKGNENCSGKHNLQTPVQFRPPQHGCDAGTIPAPMAKSVLYRPPWSPEKAPKYIGRFFCYVADTTYIQFDSFSRVWSYFVLQSR